MSAPDVNDLHRAGKLPVDPFAVAVPYAPPEQSTADEKPPLVLVADRVRQLVTLGEPHRIQTGLGWIDHITGGGLMVGKLINAIGGAPNAGKTSLMVQIAHNASRAGVPVAIHAADEAAEGIIIRIGQALGFAQEDLERRDPHALAALAGRLEGLPLLILDQDLDEVDVEGAAARLAALAEEKGAPSALLCVDSIQKARACGTDKAKDQRSRAETVVASLKRIGAHHSFAIVATSELSRGAYRNAKDRIAALAAFKDSGDIEYAARLALVLQSVPGEAGKLVDVDVPKNKAGRIEGDEAGFRMRLDRARCTYAIEPRPPSGEGDEGDMEARLDVAARKFIPKVLALVAKRGSKGATADDIEHHVTGKAASLRRAAKLAAGDGDLVLMGKRFYAPSAAVAANSAANGAAHERTH